MEMQIGVFKPITSFRPMVVCREILHWVGERLCAPVIKELEEDIADARVQHITQVAGLNDQILGLNDRIADLNDQKAEQEALIASLRRQSQKLQQNNIIDAEERQSSYARLIALAREKWIADLGELWEQKAEFALRRSQIEAEIDQKTCRLRELLIDVENREGRAKIIIERYKSIADADQMRKQIEICQNKVAYQSLEGADFACLALYYKDGRFLRAYKCGTCAYYHLASTSVPTKLVNRELVRRDGYDDDAGMHSVEAVMRFKDALSQERYREMQAEANVRIDAHIPTDVHVPLERDAHLSAKPDAHNLAVSYPQASCGA